jgi:hypothetical protein
MNSSQPRTFDKSQLQNMNIDNKYGRHWIQNANNLDNKQEYILYATGDADLSGRKYIALPANIPLNQSDKIKYNIFGNA